MILYPILPQKLTPKAENENEIWVQYIDIENGINGITFATDKKSTTTFNTIDAEKIPPAHSRVLSGFGSFALKTVSLFSQVGESAAA